MNKYYQKLCNRLGQHAWQNIKTNVLRKRITTPHISVFSNNCVGGIMLHDCGMQFQSPTVNLVIQAEPFIAMMENLQEYMRVPLMDVEAKGGVSGAIDDIQISFSHYATFESAKEKWEARVKRIAWENIRVCMTDRDGWYPELMERFVRLPYPNVFFTHCPLSSGMYTCPSEDYIVYVPGFENERSVGNIMLYKNIWGVRYYEQTFDPVHFLNKGANVFTKRHWLFR